MWYLVVKLAQWRRGNEAANIWCEMFLKKAVILQMLFTCWLAHTLFSSKLCPWFPFSTFYHLQNACNAIFYSNIDLLILYVFQNCICIFIFAFKHICVCLNWSICFPYHGIVMRSDWNFKFAWAKFSMFDRMRFKQVISQPINNGYYCTQTPDMIGIYLIHADCIESHCISIMQFEICHRERIGIGHAMPL